MSSEKPILFVSGKRKTAVAKVKIRQGAGIVSYNGLLYTDLNLFHKLALAEPLRICERELGPLGYNFDIRTMGGGKEAQIQAARLAIAKALVQLTSSELLKKAFLAYDRNLLVQDSRRKEARKPGDSKARAKRQKSYR